eukprot:Clim_evm24s9 gene=Clim_evmTU24s9
MSVALSMRRGLVLGAMAAVVYDSSVGDKKIPRTCRVYYNGFKTLVDYKFFYDPEKLHDIHLRTAQRLYDVCTKNGGLYIKFGQAVSSMNHVLPLEYRKILHGLQDKAPSVPYEDVEKIFREEFNGKTPGDLFVSFEKEPIASASIAQVHRAVTRDGERVAVKVQKPYIRPQFPYDIWGFKVTCSVLEWAFDLPMVWITKTSEYHLRKECDFRNEADYGERAAKDLQELDAKRYYVPKVRRDLSSSRILTAEWIDGAKFTDREVIEGDYGFDVGKITQAMVECIAYQIFVCGFTHADPHPGNLIVRPQPGNPRDFQLVLIDHGLYVESSETFRREYCELWKAIFELDSAVYGRICESWGVADSDLFASLQLMRPFTPSKGVHQSKPTRAEMAEMQMKAKERIKHLLADTEKVPRELVFVGRAMNYVRANNKDMGSPVNRISVMVKYAVKGLNKDGSVTMGWIQRVTFNLRLLAISVLYHAAQFYRSVNHVVFGVETGGYEEMIDAAMKNSFEREFGVEIEEDIG